ncbi:MAG: zinc-ribbon domain-containing protein [Lachnospiraceae bacterium]|nr:zinc-ribbon domain-containing protein [Lachnospiraceae bacterium]
MNEKGKVIKMAFCKNCGTQLKEGAAFCKNCGMKIGDKLPVSGLAAGNIYGMMPTHSGEQKENDTAEQVLKKLNAGKDIAVEKAKAANDRFQKWLPGAKESVTGKCRNVMERFSASSSAQPVSEGVIYCSECGAPNKENYRFCSHCGTPLIH